MRATNVNGTNLHFRLDGRPTGTTLVFVNSLGTDWRVWEEVGARLGSQYRLLFYDKRGHGLSDIPGGPLTIDNHVDDLAALLRALDIQDAVPCGISVGGMIALGLAAAHPDTVRAAVLCDTGHRIGGAEQWNQRIDAVRQGGVSAVADGVLERWFTPAFRRDRGAETALWRNMLARTTAEGYAATCAAIRDADLTTAAQSLAVPTLCLCGDGDQATPPALTRELSELIPGGRYREVADTAHLPTVERPDAVAELIGDFLGELDLG